MIRAIFLADGRRVLIAGAWSNFTVSGREFRQDEPGVVDEFDGTFWNRKQVSAPLVPNKLVFPKAAYLG